MSLGAARRRAIREITLDVLKAARTAAADRVYPTAILPWMRGRPLPAIGVYTLDERGSPLAGSTADAGPFQILQTLDLRIEVVTEVALDAELTPEERLQVDTQTPLDALCEEIERATLRNPWWYAVCDAVDGVAGWRTHVTLGGVDETDRRTAAAVITASVTFTDLFEVDERWLDLFERARVRVDVIDPAADPNTGPPGTPPNVPDGYPGGYPGPDGRIEVEFWVPRPGDPPLWPVEDLPEPPPAAEVAAAPVDLEGLLPTGPAWTTDPAEEE